MFDWKTATAHGLSLVERIWLRDSAVRISARFENPAIANIGVYRGASLHCFRAGSSSAYLFGIDIAASDLIEPTLLGAEIVRADSTTYHENFTRPIHFLFVDGSHRPQDVMADLLGWGSKVVVGGEMAFHDYLRSAEWYKRRPPSCGPRQLIGVSQAVDEWWTSTDAPTFWKEIAAPDSIKAFRRHM